MRGPLGAEVVELVNRTENYLGGEGNVRNDGLSGQDGRGAHDGKTPEGEAKYDADAPENTESARGEGDLGEVRSTDSQALKRRPDEPANPGLDADLLQQNVLLRTLKDKTHKHAPVVAHAPLSRRHGVGLLVVSGNGIGFLLLMLLLAEEEPRIWQMLDVRVYEGEWRNRPIVEVGMNERRGDDHRDAALDEGRHTQI